MPMPKHNYPPAHEPFRKEGRFVGTTSQPRIKDNLDRLPPSPKPTLDLRPDGSFAGSLEPPGHQLRREAIALENQQISKELAKAKGKARRRFNDRSTQSKGFDID